jgi:hypothetical protein
VLKRTCERFRKSFSMRLGERSGVRGWINIEKCGKRLCKLSFERFVFIFYILILLPIPGEAKAKAMPGGLYIHTRNNNKNNNK